MELNQVQPPPSPPCAQETNEKETNEKETNEKETNEETNEKETNEKETNEKETSEKETSEKETNEKETSEKETNEKETREEKTNEKETNEKETSEKETDEKGTSEKETNEKETSEKETNKKETSEKKTNEKETNEEETSEKETSEKETNEKETNEKETSEKETDEKETILEEILSEIGDSGRFQIVFTVVILVMEVVIAWSMLQAALVGATPGWWCVDPTTLGQENMTLDNSTFQTCSPSLPPPSTSSGNRNATEGTECVRYYDPDTITIVTEWDLVCERKYIKAAINSIQMAGVLVGALAAGHFSDSVGRRVTCYVTMAVHGLACLLAGFAPNWQVYATLRFFVGAGIGSYLVLHYVYVIEFVRHTWRPYLASIPSWAIGAGVLCLVAWQLPHWRYLHFVCAALSLPLLFGWFVSPESLRWLAAKGRVEEAERVMERIAQMNGRPQVAKAGEKLARLAQVENSHGGQGHRYTYHMLFKGWSNCAKTLVLAFAWMSLSMSFYGIIFGVSALSGNVYLNMFLLSVVEVPLTLATACFTIYIGRRYTGSFFFLLASLTGFGILLADRFASESDKGTIINIIAICSKLFIAAAWTCMQTFTAELYPTVIRSLGMGAANTAARVGGILAPFVLEMETADDAVKCYVIVGSIMAVSGVSILFLTETKGKSLADTLHQKQKELDI